MAPIDAVFLWVDGGDPEHRRSRRFWSAIEDTQGEVCKEQRFADHGELRYALRSISMHAPWIRRVHLVTNGQVPDWLDTSYPHMRIVTHEEIFPDSAVLPTFNSHAIELYLDRIPDLAEQFLAFNDDFFLAAPAQPHTFFTKDGQARVFLSNQWLPQKCDEQSAVWEHAVFNVGMLLSRAFGPACRRRPAHQVRPLLKSVCRDCRLMFAEDIAIASRQRFRSTKDISFAWCLVPLYSLHMGRAVPTQAKQRVVSVVNCHDISSLFRGIFFEGCDFICINDCTEEPEKALWEDVRSMLGDWFPKPSPFERVVRDRTQAEEVCQNP